MIAGGRAVRLQRRAADRPARPRPFFTDSACPPTPTSAQRAAGPGPVVDRAERRAGDAAADGAGRRRGRQRRHDHDAARDGRDRATPTGDVVDDATSRACGSTPISRRTAATHAPGDDRRGRRTARRTRLQIPRLEVGGKTGTAQLGTEPADARTPGSSASPARPDRPPQVAVAVIVEGQPGGQRGRPAAGSAAPIAQAVMQAALAGRRTADRSEPPSGRPERARPPVDH